MPQGPGTYGSKRGRPPKKKRVMGYKSGGMKRSATDSKSAGRTTDEKIEFFRKQKARAKTGKDTRKGEPLLTPRQYDGLIQELLKKKKK
jgi:hypothetical protein